MVEIIWTKSSLIDLNQFTKYVVIDNRFVEKQITKNYLCKS